jgi:hypothetical protein
LNRGSAIQSRNDCLASCALNPSGASVHAQMNVSHPQVQGSISLDAAQGPALARQSVITQPSSSGASLLTAQLRSAAPDNVDKQTTPRTGKENQVLLLLCQVVTCCAGHTRVQNMRPEMHVPVSSSGVASPWRSMLMIDQLCEVLGVNGLLQDENQFCAGMKHHAPKSVQLRQA